jgi:hypothetical protein
VCGGSIKRRQGGGHESGGTRFGCPKAGDSAICAGLLCLLYRRRARLWRSMGSSGGLDLGVWLQATGGRRRLTNSLGSCKCGPDEDVEKT